MLKAEVLNPVAASLVLVVLLSGCTSAPESRLEQANPPSRSERLQTVKECMTERGWTVEISDEGISSGLIPDGQLEKYEAANEECFSLLPPEVGFDGLPDRERRRNYDYFVHTRECLVNGGVDLPAPPSYEAWTESKGAWRPYSDIPDDQIFELYERFKDICPEVPEWAR